jgi:hypothetical protein
VVTLTNDNGMKSFAHQFRDRAMGDVDERAGRFQYLQAAFAHGVKLALRSAVRGNHYGLRVHLPGVVLELDASGPQFRQNGFVVDEVAQHSERTGLCLFLCQRNGVPDAKAHAKMFCSENFHTTLLDLLAARISG